MLGEVRNTGERATTDASLEKLFCHLPRAMMSDREPKVVVTSPVHKNLVHSHPSVSWSVTPSEKPLGICVLVLAMLTYAIVIQNIQFFGSNVFPPTSRSRIAEANGTWTCAFSRVISFSSNCCPVAVSQQNSKRKFI